MTVGPKEPISDLSLAQFKALANSIPNLVWMADADGWLVWYNQRWYDYTGTTPEDMAGWGWQSVHHPDVLPEMLQRWTSALKTGEAFEMTFPLRRGSDGSYRMFMTRAEPLKDDGKIVGWFGTNTDITELERTKEQLQLVVNELNHRVKNTLATVQSIAQNTFKNPGPSAYDVFEGRLFALSRVHDALTRAGWSKSSLTELVELSVTTFGLERFDIEGPDIPIEPRHASALGMTLHELSTNAAKYGGLSLPEGRVGIRWTTEKTGPRSFLSLAWKESGGPMVRPPTTSGYGSKLIKRATATEKDAKVDLLFEPEGVVCMLRFPIDLGVHQ